MPFSTDDVFRRLRIAFVSLALALLLLPAQAHEGHDHDAPQPTASTRSSPRVTVRSESYELVGILNKGTLRLYLDRFETNEPVPDATIVATVDGSDLTATPLGDGTYGIASAAFEGEGPLEIVFVITAPSGDDLLIGTLDLPRPDPSAAAQPSAAPDSAWAVPDFRLAGYGVP